MEDESFMPQPYRGKERPVFGHEALLKRPHLAAYIGAISTCWEGVEEAWGVLLAMALRADARVGVSLYLALTGSAAQSALLKRGIELAFEHDKMLQDNFGILWAMQKPRSEERNKVVHGRWGILPSRDDVLIMGERNWLTKAMASLSHYRMREWVEGSEFTFKEPDFKQSTYTEKDFKAILERIDFFAERQQAFIQALHKRHSRMTR